MVKRTYFRGKNYIVGTKPNRANIIDILSYILNTYFFKLFVFYLIFNVKCLHGLLGSMCIPVYIYILFIKVRCLKVESN